VRVALFVTCLADQFYAEAGVAAVKLLRSLGVSVEFPEAQSCCGQPAYNAGYRGAAREIARHTLALLDRAEYVVLPSGSCTTMLKVFYPELFREQPQVYWQAEELASKTYELSQFIVQVLGVEDLGRGLMGRRIAYHPGCHGLRELKLSEPSLLLRRAGAELVDWPAQEECCGFGGLFSVKLPSLSLAMADRKIDTLPDVEVLTSTDAGCLLQLDGRLRYRGYSISVRPLASLLWEAREQA